MVKNIITTDKNNIDTLYSVQQIRTQKLNNWKGWKCNALQHVLSIDEKGDGRGGDCESAGYLGNIYDKLKEQNNINTLVGIYLSSATLIVGIAQHQFIVKKKTTKSLRTLLKQLISFTN